MYRVETLTDLGVKTYPAHDTIEELWLEIELWELPDNYNLTYCKNEEDYQNWLDGFDDDGPSRRWNGAFGLKYARFPVWITEDNGAIEFKTTKQGMREFLWDAHFQDTQKAQITYFKG